MKTRILPALALATALLAASCSKTPAPEKFTDTAQLENIDGAMAFYSFQHPKLVVQSLDKLAAEIPEAAFLNALLSAQGARLGYPDFTEIAAGTNIGVYQPAMSLDELKLKRGQRAFLSQVFFIKLKENGKIWNMLTRQLHLQTRKQGDWTMFAFDTAAFDAVKNPDALIARLSAPQTETLRAWFSLDGDMAAAYQTLLDDALSKALSAGTLPDAEKTAFAAYAKILIGEFFASAQSARASLTLGDTSLQITGGIQNKPDSPLGIFARYRSDATPDTARYIANDAILTGVIRITPKAQRDLAEHFADQLLTVDYPPVSEPIAKLKTACDTSGYWKQMDGCVAMSMNMSMDLSDLQAPKTEGKNFTVTSGKFDTGTLQIMDESIAIAQKLVSQMMAYAVRHAPAGNLGRDLPEITFPATQPVKIEGVDFSAWTMQIRAGSENGAAARPRLLQKQTTYYGVAGGNLVTASNEADLKTRLPALLAKKVLPDNIAAANPLQPYDIASMSLNGGALTDMICATARLDMTDTDAQATIADIKSLYAQSGPARLTMEARQAALEYKADIPYKFIAASVRLGRYIYSVKNSR